MSFDELINVLCIYVHERIFWIIFWQEKNNQKQFLVFFPEQSEELRPSALFLRLVGSQREVQHVRHLLSTNRPTAVMVRRNRSSCRRGQAHSLAGSGRGPRMSSFSIVSKARLFLPKYHSLRYFHQTNTPCSDLRGKTCTCDSWPAQSKRFFLKRCNSLSKSKHE